MKKRYLLLLAFLGFISLKTTAQPRFWSTVQETDTPYFAGGVYGTKRANYGGPSGGSLFGRLIRRIYVDSVRQGAGERTLFFPKTLRCFDTSAQLWPSDAYAKAFPGWQGPFCLQKADSIDEFYNFIGDTIRIYTQAAAGTNWTLAKDSSGTEIRAQITGVGTQPMGGGPDSFREATLQAYRNGGAVAHMYNNRKLRWTKTKGWVKTLDWFAFPYGTSGLVSNFGGYGNYAAQEDTASYDRIADTLDLDYDITVSGLQNYYRPGNAWWTYTEKGFYTYKNYYRYDYDSVLSSIIVGNKCIAQMQSSSCEFRFVPPSGPSNPIGYWQATPQAGLLHTDTITADTVIIPRRLWITPDEAVGNRGWSKYLLTDIICGKPVITKDFEFGFSCNPQMSVCTLFYGNNGVGRVSYLPQMAKTGSLMAESFNEMNVLYHYNQLQYLKTASCTFGTYINVPALSVGPTAAPQNDITLSPNPASQLVHLNAPDALVGSQFSITDLQGKSVSGGRLEKGQTVVSVAELPAGFYLVRIWGDTFQQVQKLFIQR